MGSRACEGECLSRKGRGYGLVQVTMKRWSKPTGPGGKSEDHGPGRPKDPVRRVPGRLAEVSIPRADGRHPGAHAEHQKYGRGCDRERKNHGGSTPPYCLTYSHRLPARCNFGSGSSMMIRNRYRQKSHPAKPSALSGTQTPGKHRGKPWFFSKCRTPLTLMLGSLEEMNC